MKLVLQDELHNSLFVVQFDTYVDPAARLKLLALSPVKALDTYATFNKYHADFRPFNPVNFAHLVTVHIPEGTPDIFLHIRRVVRPIGKYVHWKIGLGTENHHISTLVHTRKRAFKTSADITIGKREHTIAYSFEGRNLRCRNCFGYGHAAESCSRQTPRRVVSAGRAVTVQRRPAPVARAPAQGSNQRGSSKRSKANVGPNVAPTTIASSHQPAPVTVAA